MDVGSKDMPSDVGGEGYLSSSVEYFVEWGMTTGKLGGGDEMQWILGEIVE